MNMWGCKGDQMHSLSGQLWFREALTWFYRQGRNLEMSSI